MVITNDSHLYTIDIMKRYCANKRYNTYSEAEKSMLGLLFILTGAISFDYQKYFKKKIEYKIEKNESGQYRPYIQEVF